ncbi:MAG TPA: hypothetical protein PLI95_25880, partial [Polyangiaceae bacterium]|nr:hypothetical protein [Polyangiaceae bacterium]
DGDPRVPRSPLLERQGLHADDLAGRVEPLPLEQRGPWISRVAVQFDEPLTSHESQINSFRKNHVWEED